MISYLRCKTYKLYLIWEDGCEKKEPKGFTTPKGLGLGPLELRQYKNDSIQSKNIPILKLPLFFISYTNEGKIAGISKLEFFWTESSSSYIVLALGPEI